MRHAHAWPIRNAIPSPVATLHHRLKLLRSPFFKARREKSSTMLEASRTAVLTHRIGGFGMLVQSSESPRRTTIALVKAANTMVLAASSTNSPVNDARRDDPRPSGPPPPPHPRSIGGGGGPLIMSCVRDPAIFIFWICLVFRDNPRRIRLHHKIPRSARHIV